MLAFTRLPSRSPLTLYATEARNAELTHLKVNVRDPGLSGMEPTGAAENPGSSPLLSADYSALPRHTSATN